MSEYVRTIYTYLDSVDIKHANLGYKYLLDTISLLIENPEKYVRITDAYQFVAKKYDTNSTCVERAIRYTIIHKSTTNKEFILKATHEIIFSARESA